MIGHNGVIVQQLVAMEFSKDIESVSLINKKCIKEKQTLIQGKGLRIRAMVIMLSKGIAINLNVTVKLH